ncbi:unnamed protein product [Trichobilharzia regenti]|nr:unnamed protein product [Trichobilharzia regenti]
MSNFVNEEWLRIYVRLLGVNEFFLAISSINYSFQKLDNAQHSSDVRSFLSLTIRIPQGCPDQEIYLFGIFIAPGTAATDDALGANNR